MFRLQKAEQKDIPDPHSIPKGKDFNRIPKNITYKTISDLKCGFGAMGFDRDYSMFIALITFSGICIPTRRGFEAVMVLPMCKNCLIMFMGIWRISVLTWTRFDRFS